MAGSQDGDYGFLSLFGNHRELELAFLNIENRVREIALRENNLIVLILRYRFSLADFGEKPLGVKRGLAFLWETSIGPDDGAASVQEII